MSEDNPIQELLDLDMPPALLKKVLAIVVRVQAASRDGLLQRRLADRLRAKKYRENNKGVTLRSRDPSRDGAKSDLPTSLPLLEDSVVQRKDSEVVALGRRRGHRLPPDWKPTEGDIEFALGQLPHRQVPIEVEKFKEYWYSKAGAGATKLDWSLTWKTWCRRAAERFAPRAQPRANGSQPRNWRDEQAERTYRALERLSAVANGGDEAGGDPDREPDVGELFEPKLARR